MRKILWHSVAPWCPTGYGQQTALFAPRIAALDDVDLAMSSGFGLNGGPIKWGGIHIYPGEDWNRTAYQWAVHHGQGEPCTMITLFDVWPLDPEIYAAIDKQGRLACWCPVDHDPAVPAVVDFLRASGAAPIAMSRFGENALRDAGLDPVYVPHGVDTTMFTPRDRGEIRQLLNFPEDAFVVGMVANNQGQSPARKGFSEAFLAFSIFQQTHPNAILYLHCEMTGFRNGLNLYRMLERFEVNEQQVRFTEQVNLEHVFPPGALSGLYNSFDVLLNPSYGEGFGIPIVEAQACFPAGTKAEVIDPLTTFTKPYTGRMVTLTTDRGSFEATADHPVWTASGWQSAGSVQPGDQILYCVDAAKGMEQVHTGAIDEIVGALQGDATQGCSRRIGHDLSGRVLASASGGSSREVLLRDRQIASGDPYGQPSALLCWADRWGGNGHDPKDESGEWAPSMEALHHRFEYGQTLDGLAAGSDSDTIGLRRLKGDTAWNNVLSLLGDRAGLSAALPSARATPGPQRRSDASHNRMDARAFVSIQDGPLDPAAARDRLADPRSQFDTVTAVSERYVRNLPVYNVTTASSTYRVGPGYLVHNCGTPVIVTDWTAMPELVGAGWKVGGVPWDHPMAESFWMKPDIDAIVDALEQAYESSGDDSIRAHAREFALQYDVDKVMSDYWVPALDRIHAPREVQPIGPNRKTRRAVAKQKAGVSG